VLATLETGAALAPFGAPIPPGIFYFYPMHLIKKNGI